MFEMLFAYFLSFRFQLSTVNFCYNFIELFEIVYRVVVEGGSGPFFLIQQFV